MFRRLTETLVATAFSVLALGALPAGAECFGMNILDLMPAAERAEIVAAAEAVPFPNGNYWRAERDGQQITLIGTYHLDDPRHGATLVRFGPEIAAAAALLVEAGPEEKKALIDRMARDPSILTITSGPTLLETLPKETWDRLVKATTARGIPGFMAAKFRPWYVTVLLSIPPCAMEDLKDPKGLDGLLIDSALAANVPVRALEPYDTVFKVFGMMSDAEQIEMIEQTLALEDQATDYSVTLADTYFAGENRLMWELMRYQSYAMPGSTHEQVDADMAKLEEALMISRNRAWIPVIEEAAAQGPVVAAFGALHLSGEDGVLNLLAKDGWTVTPLALP